MPWPSVFHLADQLLCWDLSKRRAPAALLQAAKLRSTVLCSHAAVSPHSRAEELGMQ